MRARRLLVACVVTCLPLTAACDAGAGDDDTAATPPRPQGAEAELAAVQRSGIGGTVHADHSGDEVTISLRLEGLEAGTAYPAHIHEGRCAAGGPVQVPLGRVTGGEDGRGSLTTRVDAESVGVDEPAFVQVHGPDGAAVACADLPGHQGGEALTERLDEDGAAGGEEDAPGADTVGGPDEEEG